MDKTPDEIKRALECCLTHKGCWPCPYDDSATKDCAICMPKLLADNLAYIRQLEAERDALMHWAKGRCDTCAHNDDCVKHDPDPEGYIMHWYDDCEIWEWRGLPEAPKEELQK